jgi:molybdopterin molybdotransferase
LENLLSVEEALAKILAIFNEKSSTTILLDDALGQILAKDVLTKVELPPFDNSSMDGFAVLASDVKDSSEERPVELEVVEDIAAGYFPKKKITTGQTSRIMTGAPLPPGADAVVPVEFTSYSDRYAQQILMDNIHVYKPVKPGDYVRPKGQDIQKGEKIFSKGHKLRAQDLGFLAAQGIDRVSVVKKPLIALLSSGDELIKPGEELIPGKIYDSNTITIKSLIKSFGAEILDLGVAQDNFEDIENKLEKTLNTEVDLIISTAGVSVGVYDFIRDVIHQDGHLNFWKVNIRPGKPLTFGQYKKNPFLGLPGNPVSAFVSTIIFVKPIIYKLLGVNENKLFFEADLLEEISSDGRESYLRAVIHSENGKNYAKLASHQGSGNIFSLVSANALLIIPAGVKCVPKGKTVKFFWI